MSCAKLSLWDWGDKREVQKEKAKTKQESIKCNKEKKNYGNVPQKFNTQAISEPVVMEQHKSTTSEYKSYPTQEYINLCYF